jgi:RNA polymerase sigma factor (TIGR02999 family)
MDAQSALSHRMTELGADASTGRRDAFDRVLPLVYVELRRAAHRQLNARRNDTLNTTALVHEAYLRLKDNERANWEDRDWFLGVAAVAMRRILVDRARRRAAEKRGGQYQFVSLDDDATVRQQAESLIDLDGALEQLAAFDERLVRVVECRFFGGLTESETARALGVTERTVRRDWVKARGLLLRALIE